MKQGSNIQIFGFTLIELLVAIAIIGVLTAVLLVNLVGIRERAADSKKKSDLNQLKNAMRLYYNDNQAYPASINSTIDACNGSCSEGESMQSASGTVYMKDVPEYTRYVVSGDKESYSVGVSLDNHSDPDIAKSVSSCGITFTGADDGIFYVCSD